jgi:serine/threonine protein kinase
MKAEDWRRIKEIFNQAIELSPDEREEFLSSFQNGDTGLRREVEKLLAADENAGAKFEDFSFVSIDNAKEKIGRYKILREIGEGGMGAVYLAEREDLPQKVALKIIRRGASSATVLRRFRKEQEILAALEHANIARLLDVGLSAEGLPFLAMEYVEGSDLLAYCAENNLSLPEKLKLFRKICDAVAYAHSRLVVHRDLKPSNILVNEKGEPKLLDFGISKLLSENSPEEKGTVTSFGMLTPNYASPEQFRGESVSTATDVYSLGVILYQLLTGKLPYDIENRRYEEASRIVCETNPQKPSEILTQRRKSAETGDKQNTTGKGQFFKGQKTRDKGRSLKGDLDNILLKALRKEPERRYSSIEKFSDDLRRHLEGLPVTARPDTFSYRAEKFIRRNRLSVVSAGLMILIFLAGVGGITWQYFRAERERRLAEKRFAEVREIANNVIFKYHDEIKNLPGATKVRETLITDALSYLDRLSEDAKTDVSLQTELARAYSRVGDVQGEPYMANVGNTAGAIESYRKSAGLFADAIGKTPETDLKRELRTVYQKMGSVLLRNINKNEGIRIATLAAELSEQIVKESPANTEDKIELARSLVIIGDNSLVGRAENESVFFYRKALAITDSINPSEAESETVLNNVGRVTQRLGFHHAELGRRVSAIEKKSESQELFRAALPFYRRSIQVTEKLVKIAPDNIRNRRNFVLLKAEEAVALREIGEDEPAMALLREALDDRLKALAADSSNVQARADLPGLYMDIALVYQNRGDFIRALENIGTALEKINQVVKNDPTNGEFWHGQFNTVLYHGDILLAKGDTEAAVRIYNEAFTELKEAPPMKGKNLSEFETSVREKIGKAWLLAAAKSNLPSAKRRDYLEKAVAEYRRAKELMIETELNPIAGSSPETIAGKIEYLQQKVSEAQNLLAGI